jgi:flagellin-specific chaperone FliS
MKNIREKADEYCKSTLVGSNYVKRNAYIQGAKDVLKELSMTLSVSNEEHLEENLMLLYNELMGDIRLENGTIDDNLEF